MAFSWFPEHCPNCVSESGETISVRRCLRPLKSRITSPIVPRSRWGRACRYVHLMTANVDPHVVQTDHHVWIARQAQAQNIEQGRQTLVGLPDVHIFEVNDIAYIFTRAVEKRFHEF